MEVANAGFDSMKRFMTGFRMPDLSRLWAGLDETDHPPPQVPLIIKLEYYLVRCQELVLWTDPKASLVALTVIHLAFGYLATTSNTALNLTLWTVLSGFIYTTWTQKIWPEIRVPDEDGVQEDAGAQSGWTPVSPDVYSAPELIELVDRLKSKTYEFYQRAAALRTDSPGVFCLYASLSCLVLGYLGTLVTTLGLLYYLVVGAFLVPGLFKLIVKHPELSQLLSNLCNKDDSVDSSNKAAQSTTPAAVPEPEEQPTLTDQVSGMMQSVCSTLTTGMATLTSQLPDMNQLEQKKKDLLSSQDDSELSHSDMEESMSPYLPDAQDLASHQILESCTRDSIFQDPTQADSFQSCGEMDDDDEDRSLLPTSMPSHDEIDTGLRDMSKRQMSLNSMQATLGSSDDSRQERLTTDEEEDEEDDNKDFLPTADAAAVVRSVSESGSCDSHEVAAQQLLLSETLDEDREGDSLLRSSFGQELQKEVAAAVDATVEEVCGPVEEAAFEDQDLSSGDDDFEVLSASEITSQQHDTAPTK